MSNIKEWFPLYAGDWLTSMDLRLCSPFARGILIDLMAYSWHNNTPGVIKESHSDLSLFLHCSEEDFSSAIATLEKRGRIERNNGKIIIKRLQVIAGEQEELHKKATESGRRGGLKKAENDRENEGSSSNPLPLKEKKVKESKEKEQKIELPYGEKFKEAWSDWGQFRKEIKKKLTSIAIDRQLKKLAEYKSEETAVAVIYQSIEKTWTGLFDLKDAISKKKQSEEYDPFEACSYDD